MSVKTAAPRRSELNATNHLPTAAQESAVALALYRRQRGRHGRRTAQEDREAGAAGNDMLALATWCLERSVTDPDRAARWLAMAQKATRLRLAAADLQGEAEAVRDELEGPPAEAKV